ncbi:MAG: T9SS type A sorting domain-containing protein [Balneolales bacterium]|nr:T9SS type A sorting domain-containing protein [Balneolales bacterium]
MNNLSTILKSRVNNTMSAAKAATITAVFLIASLLFMAPQDATAQQYTPAGLGTNGLIGWFKADSVAVDGNGNVETIFNLGSQGGNATQSDVSLRPELIPDALNGLPIIRFNQGPYLVTGSFSSTIGQPFTSAVHIRPNFIPGNGSIGVIYDSASGSDVLLFTETTTSGFPPVESRSIRLNAGLNGASQPYLDQSFFTQVNLINGNSSRQSNYTTGDETTQGVGNNSFDGGFNIGAYKGGFFPYSGDLSELIFYSRSLSQTERILIANYLRAKWGGPIDEDFDKFSIVTNNNQTFDQELIGIGRETSNTVSPVVSTQSGTGGVRISTTAATQSNSFVNTNGRYLLAAHNGEAAELVAPNPGDSFRRTERVWRVQRTLPDGDSGAGVINIIVDFANNPNLAPEPDELLYLVYNEDDSSFTPATTQIIPINSITQSGGTVTIATDGRYFETGFYALVAQPFDPNDPSKPGIVSDFALGTTEINASTNLIGAYHRVEITGGETLVLVPGNQGLRIMDELTVGPGSGLHIQPNASFNTTVENSRIFIESGGRYLNEGNTNPTLLMEREFGSNEGAEWRLLSYPISSPSSSFADFINYDSETGTGFWTQGRPGALSTVGAPGVREYVNGSFLTPVPDLNNIMVPGRGFAAFVYNCNQYTTNTSCVGGTNPSIGDWPKRLVVEGIETRSNVTIPSLGAGSFQLIGNPFPSSVNRAAVLNANSGTSTTVYYFDSVAGIYRNWNGSSGDNPGNDNLAPFQSFWIDLGNFTGSNVTIPAEARRVTTADGNTGLLNDGGDSNLPPAIVFSISKNDIEYTSWVSWSAEGSFGRDLDDGFTLTPMSLRPYVNVATLADFGGSSLTQLSINNLPLNNDGPFTIPVVADYLVPNSTNNGWVAQSAELTITWPQLRNLPDEWSVELHDTETGAVIDMLEEFSYTFTSNGSLSTRGINEVAKQIHASLDSFKQTYTDDSGVSILSDGNDTRLQLIITPGPGENSHEALITGPNEGWRMISAPFDGVTYENLLNTIWTQGFAGAGSDSGAPNVFWFDESDRENPLTGGWNAPASMQDFVGSSSTDVAFSNTAGKTVLVYVYSDDNADGTPNGFPKVLNVTGDTFSDTRTKNLSFTNPAAEGTGFNLIGNPYRGPLSWSSLINDEANEDAGFSEAVYIWDANIGASGAYRVYNASLDLGVTLPGNPQLSPLQGFWSLALEEDAEITFKPDFVVPEGAGSRSSDEPSPFIVMEIEGGDEASLAGFTFTANGRNSFDKGDGLLLESLGNNWLHLFSKAETGQRLSLNNLPLEGSSLEIPLYVDGTVSGDMSLNIPAMGGLGDGWVVELRNEATGAIYQLHEGFELIFSFESTAEAREADSNTNGIAAELTVPQLAAAPEAVQPFTLLVTYGTSTSAGTETELPRELSLKQNYPNPFNPTTIIEFAMPEQSHVRLEVFDLTGRRVAMLLDESRNAGQHSVMFDASRLASGVYLYRLSSNGKIMTKKMTLIK